MSETVNRVLERARSYVGMRSRVNKVNDFGARYGVNGSNWDGAFLQTVFDEEQVRVGTSLVSTVAALSAFMRANRVYQKPRVGDIVFLAWSVDEPLGQPHVGIVTDVKDWKKLGKIRTVEGQASSGLPRGPKEADGVYERTRYSPEVVGFARPKYTAIETVNREPVDGEAVLRPSTVPQKLMSEYTNETVLIQLALNRVTGVTGLNRGVYDHLTRAAVSDFQRRIGHLDANGFPDFRTLASLAAFTDQEYFRASM
jgi:hypothetical protein